MRWVSMPSTRLLALGGKQLCTSVPAPLCVLEAFLALRTYMQPEPSLYNVTLPQGRRPTADHTNDTHCPCMGRQQTIGSACCMEKARPWHLETSMLGGLIPRGVMSKRVDQLPCHTESFRCVVNTCIELPTRYLRVDGSVLFLCGSCGGESVAPIGSPTSSELANPAMGMKMNAEK